MSILKMLGEAVWNLIRALFSSVGGIVRNLFHPLALTFRSVFKIKPGEIKRPFLILISVVVIGVSVASIWGFFAERSFNSKSVNLKPYQGIGEVIADETVKLLSGQGDIVIVVAQPTGRPVPTVTAPVEKFRAQLKGHPGIRIVATEAIPTEVHILSQPDMLLSGEQFISYLNKYSSAAAIVSFVGIPLLTESDWNNLPKFRPKIIDASPYHPQLRTLIERDVVQVAIQPRQPGNESAAQATTPREWFAKYYFVVTAANAKDLPDYGNTAARR